jgi:hypothetical protein
MLTRNSGWTDATGTDRASAFGETHLNRNFSNRTGCYRWCRGCSRKTPVSIRDFSKNPNPPLCPLCSPPC